jgi:hypothetical protein
MVFIKHTNYGNSFLLQAFQETVTQSRILKILQAFRRNVSPSSLGWFNLVHLDALVTGRSRMSIRWKDVQDCGNSELLKRATEWVLKLSCTADIFLPLNHSSPHVNLIQSLWRWGQHNPPKRLSKQYSTRNNKKTTTCILYLIPLFRY